MQMHKHTRIAGAFMAAVAIVSALLAPGFALADEDIEYLEYQPMSNPVADNVTRLEVNKLAADTHDYVQGAHLVIYAADDSAKTPVAEWTTDGTAHEIAQALNVDTQYVLHEVSVPQGYGLAQDVTFVLHSEDFNTTGEIVSGGYRLDANGAVEKDANGNPVVNAEFSTVSGSGPEQAFVISLYDPVKPREEKKEIHKQREVQNQRQNLVKTGDILNQPLMIGLAVGGLAIVAYGIYRKRKQQ